MKILLGTTTPSKARTFAAQLEGWPVEFLTLTDLRLQKHPDEDGKNPAENAMIKAAYYGQFHDPVIAEDSALYILELPFDDPRQPGLFVRRAPDGHEMDDGEMLEYYAALAHSLGGRATACYLDGYAVFRKGQVFGFMDDSEEGRRLHAFYLVDRPHPIRRPGWPLDSLSIDPKTGLYFTQPNARGALSPKEKAATRAYRDRLLAFYVQSLELEE